MARKKVEIFVKIQNEKEFENIIKGNPDRLICAEVYSGFVGSCTALDRLFTTIKMDWSDGQMILLKIVENFVYLGSNISNNGSCEGEIRRRIGMAKNAMSQLQRIWKDRTISIKTKTNLVPADEIEALQRFRNQSEPVYLFILNEKVTKCFRGVDAINFAEVVKKELYYHTMEQAGSVTDRRLYNLDEPTPDEMVWLRARAAEKKQESSNVAYRLATRQAARKQHRAELMVPHLQHLSFVLFWPHTIHAHPELYGRWDMNKYKETALIRSIQQASQPQGPSQQRIASWFLGITQRPKVPSHSSTRLDSPQTYIYNIVMVSREVLQLTKEKADDILYAGDAPVNEASMHKLLSAPALAICFRILDTDKHFVSVVRTILYEVPPIDEDKPLNEQLPRRPAFDLYKSFSHTREQVWQMRREAKIQRKQEEIYKRKRRLSEMQRLARQAIEEAVEARTREKEKRKMELLKAGNLTALDEMANEIDEEISIVIPEELPEEMDEESSEEEDENEYLPPPGLLIPGFYAPPNDIAKANGLAILFPKLVLECVVTQPEFLPPHVLVMLSISQRYTAIDILRKHKSYVIHMGIFRAPTPYDAAHVAYSVRQFDRMDMPLDNVEVKLALMLSVKVDIPLLELMDLAPLHVSRDPSAGEDECAALFPVDYGDSYPQYEDFGDMTILNPKGDAS